MMMEELFIRESRQDDLVAVESLYKEAFPNENLTPLVRDLLDDGLDAISLVGTIDEQLVGHVVFTKCGVAGKSVNLALLGPLAVAPSWQGQGIGSAIVRAGLQRVEDAGVDRVYVLGDPAYYGRFGFRAESSVQPPFPFPADLPPEWEGAWQSKNVGKTTMSGAGKLSVPPPWLKPALWAP
ncbi:MAG: GNAT family N-acetyltransferase [Gammaproteobacteria bacterium]